LAYNFAAILLLLSTAATGFGMETNGLASDVRTATGWLAAGPSRVVGMPEHDAVVKRLQEEIRALPGVKIWTQSFPVVMPLVSEAMLTVTGGSAAGRHEVYPLWPAGARLNTTPPEGIDGDLVYVGRGGFADIPVRRLWGQIAVMEMRGGANWQTLFAAGARAVILLGSVDDTYEAAGTHLAPIPVYFPRFYVPEGELAQALRSPSSAHGAIVARAAWREVQAVNTFALVGRSNGGRAQAICIAVPVDAMSVVPGLAPGADAAVDAALALTLLRRWAADPPPRPVMFAFVDAFAEDETGMREMLLAFGTLPETRAAMQQEDLDLQRTYRSQVACLRQLETGGAGAAGPDSDRLGRIRRTACRELHAPVREECQRQLLAVNALLAPLRLEQPAAAAGRRAVVDQEIGRLDARAGALRRTQSYLLQGRPVAADDGAIIADVWEKSRTRMLSQLEELDRVLARDAARDELRRVVLGALGWSDGDMALARVLPVAFVLGLDLSDAGCAAGPMVYDGFLRTGEESTSSDFMRWARGLARDNLRGLPESLRPAVELGPLMGMESAGSFVVGRVATLTGMLRSFGMPGATWATLEGERTRVDTPNDCAGRLDWNRLAPQVEATALLLDAWVRDPAFTVTPLALSPHVERARGSVMDQAEGDAVARIPMAAYVTVLAPRVEKRVVHVPVPGMRYQEVGFTGTDGRFRFDAVPARGYRNYDVAVESYLLDAAGRPVRAVNQMAQGDLVAMSFAPDERKPKAMRAVVFTCEELSMAGLFDPRFLMPLSDVSVLDAWRGDAKRLNVGVWNGLLSALLEPGRPWQVMARAGVAGNRLALANVMSPEDSEGVPPHLALRGFRTADGLPAHPFEVSARDFLNLDTRRLLDYRRAGIASRTIEQVQAATRLDLADAERAWKTNDGAAYFREVAAAMGNETRAYGAVRATANDVVRGVVFLLLLLVPCAYALERLLLASTHVYRQLAGSTGIFAVLAFLLWSFHPAFRMGGAPMMILLAFGVILLSLMVMRVVYAKFEGELKKLRSQFAESSGAASAGMKLAGTQIRLGLANMRRRPLRTVLTGVTVMLVTFSLLCFMSTSTYVQRSEYTIPGVSGRPSVLVRLPGYAPLARAALDYIRSAAGDRGQAIAPRYWWCAPGDPQWRMHVRRAAGGRSIALSAVLGVDGCEAEVSGIDRVCPGWATFRQSGGCYLSTDAAAELGAHPGDLLVIAGRSQPLVGVFDARRFDREVRAIDGHALLPPNYAMMDPTERWERQQGGIEDVFVKLQAGVVEEAASSIPDLQSRQVAIVPAALVRNMMDGSLRSVAIPATDGRDAGALASTLSDRLAFPVYYASEEHVKVLVSRPLAPKAPRSLLIPLLIAGFIIFNTMLSSLAERRQEIHVYTSLGLAPFHIGMMFVAEALTYGVIGAIVGYVGGQALATVFGRLGWMGGMTLNFGGTQAAMTMLLVLGIVTLSSLVPAYLAGKMAAPSNEMKWRVPAAVAEAGRLMIRDRLPFTATCVTVPGVLAFLHEYLDALRDGAIGHMTTADLSVFRSGGDERPMVLGVDATVWLAPYDVGVRQRLRLELREQRDEEDLYTIEIALTHQSGPLRSWHRLNRQCLSDLRCQLLGWRKVEESRVWGYIDRGKALLQAAAAQPRQDG
jgi:hypothetical protein